MYPELRFESWSLSTYFVIISIDFCLMLFYLRHRARKHGFSVVPTLDLGIFVSLFGFLGARLFHVLYEEPKFYTAHPLNIFKVWEGGYVFLGGIITGFLSGLVWLKLRHQPIKRYLDLFAPIMALGYALGRLACFFQGCCYGKQTDSIWGLHFDALIQAGESIARHPTQLYAFGGELLLYFILIYTEKKKKDLLPEGQLFIYWMIGHGINRMAMELFRDDPRGPLWLGMGISFWIAIVLFITGIGLSARGKINWALKRLKQN